MAQVRFDPVEHKYFLPVGNSGREDEIPGITAILRSAGLLAGIEAATGPRAPYYMARGSRVHEAIHAHLEGDLDNDALDEHESGKVRAAAQFLSDSRLEVLGAEVLVVDEIQRFATQVDCLAANDDAVWVLNWKSTLEDPVYAIQSAGEVLAVQAIPPAVAALTPYRRAGVHLRPDGTYRVREHTDRSDFDLFRAALKIYWWKREKGAKE